MSTQSVTLNMPEALYGHLKRRAEGSQRSFEEETLEVLASAVTDLEELPSDLADAIDGLRVLDDASLWHVLSGQFPEELSEELESLHGEHHPLTNAQSQRLAELIRRYERHMLVRAQAAALLRDRGHDLTELGES